MSRALLAIVFSLASVVLGAAGELDVARQALRDGLWDIARTHASREASSEAKLVILESLAGEGKWQEIGERLKGWTDLKGAGFDYYRAVVAGDHAAAMEILKKAGSPEGLLEARLHEAEALAKSGDHPGATALWREAASSTNLGERALAIVSANLMDAELLRKAAATVRSVELRRLVGLRLGMVQLRNEKTSAEGEKLIRAIVKDSPDADGARDAFISVADAKIAASLWKEAVEAYREAIEIWPEAARLATVQEGRGWALQKLGRREEALEAFRQAGELATEDAGHATALLKVGDVLTELGRIDEALAAYREVMEKYPKTTVAAKLKAVLRLRELESEGRRLYGEFRFAEAMKTFERVAEADSARRQRMNFFGVLCLYGLGNDEEAESRARSLIASCADPAVRSEATMWLAKFLYNRRAWKESGKLFAAYAATEPGEEASGEALLWAARAALADNDCALAIQLSTRLSERYPGASAKPAALLVQGEALVEQARFDEAVLVFERAIAGESVRPEDRLRAQTLKADALYAMGADNPARYKAALDAYQAIRFGGSLPAGGRIVIAFKIARALEKLKRVDEALDQYYTQVVLAYREGRLRGERFGDDVRAAFSRAAFRLADEYESRGKGRQAMNVLELVADSDVLAAEEARRRIERISNSGSFL